MKNGWLSCFNIIINGRNHTVQGRTKSYSDIVELAYPGSKRKDYTMTYFISRTTAGLFLGDKLGGIVAYNERVRIAEGMSFNVVHTTGA